VTIGTALPLGGKGSSDRTLLERAIGNQRFLMVRETPGAINSNSRRAVFCGCCGIPTVSTSPQRQTNTCISGNTPALGTVRISGITWPHRPQRAKGRLLGKAAIARLDIFCVFCAMHNKVNPLVFHLLSWILRVGQMSQTRCTLVGYHARASADTLQLPELRRQI
jgi:hypothetical protein